MNERIKELAKQADNYAHRSEALMNTYGRPANPRKFQQDRDTKFAELLVKECVNTIDPKTGTKWIKDQTQEEFWKNQSVHLIKEHFGVEE